MTQGQAKRRAAGSSSCSPSSAPARADSKTTDGASVDAAGGSGASEPPATRGDLSHQLIVLAIVSRVVLVLLVLAVAHVVPDYDTSTLVSRALDVQATGQAAMLNPSSDAMRGVYQLLAPFYKWDAVHFVRQAEFGYEFEHNTAFPPLYPALARLAAVGVQRYLLPGWPLRLLIMLAAWTISQIAFVIATAVLFHLGEAVLDDTEYAFQAAVLFTFNPASIFFSSMYTESLFAVLSWAGIMLYIRSARGISGLEARVLAVALWSAASVVRGNGILHVGFVLWFSFRRFMISDVPGAFAIELLASTMETALIAGPWVLYQVFVYNIWCLADGTTAMPNGASAWCFDQVPYAYSYIQHEYWDNGFLTYWQVKNIPNFALAAPMLALSVSGIYTSWSFDWIRVPTLDLRTRYHDMLRKGRPALPSPYFSQYTFVFTYYWAFLAAVGLFYMNVQVATRLLAAAMPMVYWYSVYLCRRSRWHRYLVLLYFLSYYFVGACMFSTFFPWT